MTAARKNISVEKKLVMAVVVNYSVAIIGSSSLDRIDAKQANKFIF